MECDRFQMHNPVTHRLCVAWVLTAQLSFHHRVSDSSNLLPPCPLVTTKVLSVAMRFLWGVPLSVLIVHLFWSLAYGHILVAFHTEDYS